MKRVVIADADRGLGLELVRQYLERGDFVVAGAPDPDASTGLVALYERFPDMLLAHPLDPADASSIEEFWDAMRDRENGCEVLIADAAPDALARQFLDLLSLGDSPVAAHLTLGGASTPDPALVEELRAKDVACVVVDGGDLPAESHEGNAFEAPGAVIIRLLDGVTLEQTGSLLPLGDTGTTS